MSLVFSPLFSGSSGNSVFVGAEGVNLLIDAGLSGAAIEGALMGIGESLRTVRAILVTHEHIDHIRGVGVLSRKYDIPVFANRPTWEAMAEKVGPIREKNICVYDEGDFYINDVNIEAVRTPHDAAMPVGYRITCGKKSVAVMTDLGHWTKKIVMRLKNTDIVLLESNHDPAMLRASRYPKHLQNRIAGDKGHLSNEDAGDAAAELVENGVKGILLGHLSEENNTEELAYETVCQRLLNANIRAGRDVALGLAFRTKTAGVFCL